jgi:ketosteroid isomerase-like protein
MSEDDDAIRRLVERWADAVHRGDIDGVLADHAQDIVMFDVPPAHEGVRSIEAYRATWPPFFEWQAQAASLRPGTMLPAGAAPGLPGLRIESARGARR